MNATDVSRHTFATVRRGYEPHEVRSYLEQVARELQSWEQRDENLRGQLAEALEAARNPVLDEATLSAALGAQSAKVLRNAHDEAARIMTQAEEQATALVHDAQQQATDIRVEAESAAAERIAEAELSAGSVEQEVREQAESLTARAREEADAIATQASEDADTVIERAREQGRSVLMKAQEARRDVLADLALRRKALHLQIEQFRAARDQLAATVLGVRESVDNIVSDLGNADERARAAAAGVAESAGAAPAGTMDIVDELPGADDEPFVLDHMTEADAGPTESAEPLVDAAAPEVEPEPDDGWAPEAEADAPEALDPEAAHPNEAGSSVDALFARIRAGQGEDDANGTEAPAEDDGTGADGDSGDDAQAAAGEPADQDAALLELRSSVLDPIVANLARRLKRSLQDDQNRLLDLLRHDSVSADLSLPGERQRQAYVETATPQLREAFAAGAAFARELSPGEDRGEPDGAAVEALADELAAEVVATLRRRLSGDEDTGEDPVERVRAAYREWRGERIERLVGDVSLGAFSQGVLAGTGGGVSVRWLLAAHDGACADCDDNSLADPVAPGAEFPTGHRHPPAHAGCRCLVAPSTA